MDDNPDDVLFLQEATRMAGVPLSIHCTGGLTTAVDYLSKIAQVSDHQRYAGPDLALLDCNFRSNCGPNLIHWIRTHPSFKSLPIVVLVGSEAPVLISRCYEIGADHFLVKPRCQLLSRLSAIVHALHEYVASNPSCSELLLRLPEYRPGPPRATPTPSSAPVVPWLPSNSRPPA